MSFDVGDLWKLADHGGNYSQSADSILYFCRDFWQTNFPTPFEIEDCLIFLKKSVQFSEKSSFSWIWLPIESNLKMLHSFDNYNAKYLYLTFIKAANLIHYLKQPTSVFCHAVSDVSVSAITLSLLCIIFRFFHNVICCLWELYLVERKFVNLKTAGDFYPTIFA